MSDGSEINLYELAFGLAADTEAPDPYTLLKLPPYTADAAVIEKAVLQRWSDLQVLQGFGDGSEVTQLETEVNAARELLLDDARRKDLDDRLREQGVAPPAVPEPSELPDKQATDGSTQQANGDRSAPSDVKSETSNSESFGEAIDRDETATHAAVDSQGVKEPEPISEEISQEDRENNAQLEAQNAIRKLKASDSIKRTDTPSSSNDATSVNPTKISDPTDAESDTQITPQEDTQKQDTSRPKKVRKRRTLSKRKRRRGSKIVGLIVLMLAVALVELTTQQVSALWGRIDFDRIASYFQSSDPTPSDAPDDHHRISVPGDTSHATTAASVDDSNAQAPTTDTTGVPKSDAWQQIEVSDAAILNAVTSPDGSLLAVATADQRLQVVSAVEPSKLFYRSDVMQLEEVEQLKFNANGTTLLVSDSESVHWWKKQNNWQRGGSMPAAGGAQFAWSGDGQQLAVTDFPNSQVTVFDVSRSKPREVIRQTGNYVRAAFVGNSNLFVTAGDNNLSSSAGGNYTELTNWHDAFIQVRDSKTAELTDVLNVPLLRNKASKIRTIAADKNSKESAIAMFSSVDAESQNLHVWVRSNEFPSKSTRHQIVTTSLETLSGLQLHVDANLRKVSIQTDRDCLVFDWSTVSSSHYKVAQKSKDRLVDLNLQTGQVIVLSNGQMKTAAFADVSSSIEPSAMSPTQQRLASTSDSLGTESVEALFWRSRYEGRTYVDTSDHVIDAFKTPRCRVQFLSEGIFVVRCAGSGNEDRVIGFTTTTDPPSEVFKTTLKTRDVLTVSPDHSFMVSLSHNDSNKKLKVKAFDIEKQAWGTGVVLETEKTNQIAVAITDWPVRDSWQSLTRLKPPLHDDSNGLRFSANLRARQTPYVHFAIIGDKWIGTLRVDIRTLFAGLSVVGAIGTTWPTEIEQIPTNFSTKDIRRTSFSRAGSTAIGQYAFDAEQGNQGGQQSSSLVRFQFGRVLAHESRPILGTLGYLDHWARTPDDLAVVTDRGGLAIVGGPPGKSMGQGQLRFDRGNSRNGALATSPNGNTFLMINRFGSAQLLNWFRPVDQGRQMLQLSQEKLVATGIDSWVNLRPAEIDSRSNWRPANLAAANMRLRGRRLSVAFSPSGALLAVGTPDGVLLWKIPSRFNQMADEMARNNATKNTLDKPANRIRPASFNRIVDLKMIGDLLVASVEDDQNQIEVYAVDDQKFVRAATANVAGKIARLTKYSARSIRNGLAIATDHGQLFLIPDVSVAMRQTQLQTSSPLSTTSATRPEDASISALTASTSSEGLLAYTTPKARLLVAPNATKTVVHRRSISESTYRDYVAFSQPIKRGSTTETLMGEIRNLKASSKRVYKLYLYSVTSRSSQLPTHVANTEITTGDPIGSPVIIETSTREAIVAVPTQKGVTLYGLRRGKLTILGQQTIANASVLAVSDSGTQIAVGTANGEILLWGQPVNELPDKPKSFEDVVTTLNGGVAPDNNDFNTFVSQAKIQAHKDEVSAIAFSSDGHSIISGSIIGEIKVFPVTTGR